MNYYCDKTQEEKQSLVGFLRYLLIDYSPRCIVRDLGEPLVTREGGFSYSFVNNCVLNGLFQQDNNSIHAARMSLNGSALETQTRAVDNGDCGLGRWKAPVQVRGAGGGALKSQWIDNRSVSARHFVSEELKHVHRMERPVKSVFLDRTHRECIEVRSAEPWRLLQPQPKGETRKSSDMTMLTG